MYLGHEPSHAIRKGPLLRLDEGLVAGLFAPEQITPRAPDAAEYDLAARAYRAIPFAPPLYARIDMIRTDDGRPALLELELTEPSLFFAYAPGSADRLARRVLADLG
jgi:O-ureido-D-serine cyclo-ligase